MFLGEDLLPLLILAFGAALFAGYGLALVRPPGGVDGGSDRGGDGDHAEPAGPSDSEGDAAPTRAPTGRLIALALMGLVAAVWGAATALTN